MWWLALLLLMAFVGTQVFAADVAVCVLNDTDDATTNKAGPRTPAG
jgi:hypothetical protein